MISKLPTLVEQLIDSCVDELLPCNRNTRILLKYNHRGIVHVRTWCVSISMDMNLIIIAFFFYLKKSLHNGFPRLLLELSKTFPLEFLIDFKLQSIPHYFSHLQMFKLKKKFSQRKGFACFFVILVRL